MGRKLGGPCPFIRGGGAGSQSSTMWPAPRPTLHTKWHVDPYNLLATIDMGRKLVALPPFGGGGTWSPSNTMSLGSSATFLPSGILIHPAIWPQQIWAENWGLCPFAAEELGPHLAQCGQGQGLPPCQVSS